MLTLQTAAAVLALALTAPPNPSFDSLPFGNGFGAAVVEEEQGRLTTLLPHGYAERAPGELTPDVCAGSYLGVALDGDGGDWLDEIDAESVAYEPGTGVVRVVHEVDDLLIETTLLSPWTLERPAVALVARITNTDAFEDHEITVAALADYHLGLGAPEAGSDDETVHLSAPNTYLESGQKTDHRMVHYSLTTANQFAATPDDPRPAFEDDGTIGGGAAGDINEPVDVDDAVVGFARGPLPLAAGETLWFGLLSAYGTADEEDTLASEVATWVAGRSPEQLLTDELVGWETWHESDTFATALAERTGAPVDPDELAVWTQGLATLRMGQVREANTTSAWPHGQLLASLPPGERNRSWPRDAAYAAVALDRTGFTDEAWDALTFVLDGQANGFVDQIGTDYLVSVARYFGNGTEQSDGDPETVGPNIELDNFGLVLWALADFLDRHPVTHLAQVEAYWPEITTKIADVLVGLIEADTGLLPADSSIWERHSNGNEKHFTYTNIAGAAGLCGASRMAARLGDDELATQYAAAAAALRDATLTHLVDEGGALAGNLEELGADAVDAAVVEAINWGLVAADGPVAAATVASFEQTLRIDPTRGFARNDDEGEDGHDAQESVFVDLRVAAAYALAGQPEDADLLVDWVTAQARVNHDLLAERYTVEDAAYAGATPTTGYGAAALALARLGAVPVMDAAGCLPAELDPDDPEPGPEPGPEPQPEAVDDPADATGDPGTPDVGPAAEPFVLPPPPPDEGGCEATPGKVRGAWWLGLLLLGLALRAGRSRRRLRRPRAA